MISITRLIAAVLVLTGTVLLTGCDQPDDSAAPSGTTSGGSSQTETGAAPEQPATGTTTTP